MIGTKVRKLSFFLCWELNPLREFFNWNRKIAKNERGGSVVFKRIFCGKSIERIERKFFEVNWNYKNVN